MKFSGDHPRKLRFEVTGDLRFRSKMAANDIIRNFKIRIILTIFTFACTWACFSGLLESYFFLVCKCCYFKWLNNELKTELIPTVLLCQAILWNKENTGAILATWRLGPALSLHLTALERFLMEFHLWRHLLGVSCNWKLSFLF